MYLTLIGLKMRFWGFRTDARACFPVERWWMWDGIDIIFILMKP